MKNGDVTLLENVRFHAEEEKNDAAFAKALAALGDIFVNDAFGAAHRAHASTAGIAHHIGQAAMGLLMEKELTYLEGELDNPARPFLVILGGAKVSDKIGVIKALMEKADVFLIGGAMAYTFYKALGIPTGKSRVEADKVDLAEELLELAKRREVRFILPVDNLETQEFSANATPRATPVLTADAGISEGWEGVDIGPETIKLFQAEIAQAKTILWNGPVGVFELAPFAKGTRAVAEAVAAFLRCHDHRRRRFGDSGEAIWPGRPGDLLLDGRRRFAGVARRQGTARSSSSHRQVRRRFPSVSRMRKKIIAANWKMNMTIDEAQGFLEKFLRELGDEKRVDVVVIPAFTALGAVSARLNTVQNVKLGAQNMHWEKSGAFTGEICAEMLRELFVKYVVLGHSERRTLFRRERRDRESQTARRARGNARSDSVPGRDARGARWPPSGGGARTAIARQPRRSRRQGIVEDDHRL